jgi:hypothetical protein
MTDDRRVIEDYLVELDALAAARLTTGRRHELIADIRGHIESAVAAGEPATDVLRRLGVPAEIVAAESPDVWLPATGPRLRLQEVSAIILLLVGGFVFVVGWFFGVALLWSSDRWTVRDKLIGTLLWPGGLVSVFVVGAAAPTTTTDSVTSCHPGGCTSTIYPSVGPPAWVGILIAILLFGVPIMTSIYLTRRARAAIAV